MMMISYNQMCNKKYPSFYENINLIRLNSPYFTTDELEDVLKNNPSMKFLDINIQIRMKDRKRQHNFIKLLNLASKYNVDWIGVSNVENGNQYIYLKKIINNNKVKICAKIENEAGCDNILDIIDVYDSILVDVEDLAFNVGWNKAIEERDRIYKLCEEYNKPYFKLSGIMFEYIK